MIHSFKRNVEIHIRVHSPWGRHTHSNAISTLQAKALAGSPWQPLVWRGPTSWAHWLQPSAVCLIKSVWWCCSPPPPPLSALCTRTVRLPEGFDSFQSPSRDSVKCCTLQSLSHSCHTVMLLFCGFSEAGPRWVSSAGVKSGVSPWFSRLYVLFTFVVFANRNSNIENVTKDLFSAITKTKTRNW